MKILFHSNAPFINSGYGNQARIIGKQMTALGHQVDYSANYGLQGQIMDMDDDQRIYPSLTTDQRDMFLLPGHARATKADIVLTLYDVWSLDARSLRQFRWVPMVPVEWDRLPQYLQSMLSLAFRVIAYSKFGQELLNKEGIDAYYLPHCVDTDVFYPRGKIIGRRNLGIPDDAFFAVMVAMNKGFPSRKSIPEVLYAWHDFINNTNEKNAFLYLHTTDSTALGGVDIRQIILSLGIKDSVILPDPYSYHMGWLQEKMAELYSAADVTLLPSHSEAFGLPIIESQACATPVITSNFGPMKELCGCGYLVDGQPEWHFLGAWRFQPFISSITKALEKALADKRSKKMGTMAGDCILFAEDYSVQNVTETYLRPLLDDLSKIVKATGSLSTLKEL